MATLLDKLMIANNLFAVGAGAYHGFCRSRGIEIDPNSFTASTLYGPTLLMAGLGALKAQKGEYDRPISPGITGFVGIVHGAFVTGIGFGLGYLVGMTTT